MLFNKRLFFWDQENFLLHKQNTKKIYIESTTPHKLVGLNLSLSGRLKGVKRTKKVFLKTGRIKAQTHNFYVQTFSQFVQTKWGKYGISLNLGYN